MSSAIRSLRTSAATRSFDSTRCSAACGGRGGRYRIGRLTSLDIQQLHWLFVPQQFLHIGTTEGAK